jgi:hypothetical protein
MVYSTLWSPASGRHGHGVRAHAMRGRCLVVRGTGNPHRMDNVIWAALIAVAGSGLTSTVAVWASTRVARGQHGVELARITGERDRLQDAHDEVERRNRQDMYLRLQAVLNRWDMYATGWPPRDDETYTASLDEYNTLHAAILTLGSQAVADALGPVTDRLTLLGADMAAQHAGQHWERFANAYPPHRNALIEATANLVLAMRADVALVDRRGAAAPGPRLAP